MSEWGDPKIPPGTTQWCRAIASGESEFTRIDLRDLIELRAMHILQPDLHVAAVAYSGLYSKIRSPPIRCCTNWLSKFSGVDGCIEIRRPAGAWA